MDLPEPDQPAERLVRIDVIVILPRRLVWLLAGLAVEGAIDGAVDGLLDKAVTLVRALLP
jgi:hypothetical protein